MTETERDYIFEKALELFNYGQKLADDAGLILVDTKYEFGKDVNGKILLIDQLHTCDSSRYWIKSSYATRFNLGVEPEKLDKDCIRDWVKDNCDPYSDNIPEIPKKIIDKAYNCYKQFYDMITFEEEISVFPMNLNNHILTEDPDFPDYSIFLSMSPHSNNIDFIQAPPPPPPSPLSITTIITHITPMVIILSESVTDVSHVSKITKQLTYTNVNSIQFVASAHRNTRDLLDIIEKYDNDEQYKIIWVTVAGRSNALSGIVAANSKYPVIACPRFTDKMDMLTNIHSTLQCPTGVPVMTILEPENVALAIKKMV
jgi:phosphoribosylaminoimidazole carboxylase PurE protein